MARTNSSHILTKNPFYYEIVSFCIIIITVVVVNNNNPFIRYPDSFLFTLYTFLLVANDIVKCIEKKHGRELSNNWHHYNRKYIEDCRRVEPAFCLLFFYFLSSLIYNNRKIWLINDSKAYYRSFFLSQQVAFSTFFFTLRNVFVVLSNFRPLIDQIKCDVYYSRVVFYEKEENLLQRRWNNF